MNWKFSGYPLRLHTSVYQIFSGAKKQETVDCIFVINGFLMFFFLLVTPKTPTLSQLENCVTTL
jgi:hypothetical protein